MGDYESNNPVGRHDDNPGGGNPVSGYKDNSFIIFLILILLLLGGGPFNLNSFNQKQ